MRTKAVAIIVASLIGIAFLGLNIWLRMRSDKSNPPVVSYELNDAAKADAQVLPVGKRPEPETQADIPAYRVVSDRIEYDNALRSQIETSVFIEEHVTEDNLRSLLEHLYALAKARGPFQYRERPNYVFVYVHARQGQDWIAMGSGTATSKFKVQIRHELLATVNDPPVVRFGLTEAERQMIFRDIVRVEDRAYYEAEQLYPFPMPKNDPAYTETGEKQQLQRQSDYARELIKQYRAELAESLGLTIDQLEAIGNEGARNWWETPPPPEASP